jgi:hypothetical protein
MRLQELLLELDAREKRFTGIKDGETQKAYKERMKKEKEKKAKKSEVNKRYRIKQNELKKATNHAVKEFELMKMALNGISKGGHRNEYFLPANVKSKAPFKVEKDEMIALPFTKAVAAKIKEITPTRGTLIEGIRYWFLEQSDYDEVREVIEDEMNALIRKKMSDEKLEKYFAESITIEELESLLVE